MTDPNRGQTLFLAVLAAAITSALTTYGLRALENAPGGEETPETVEVPALLGLAQATATELAKNRSLRLVVRGEEPSAEHEEGSVATQEPLAGSMVASDSPVSVTISTGPPNVEIPNLVGRPLADARSRIEDLGLEVGTVTEAQTPEGEEPAGPPGTVVSTDPEAGEEVELGSEVAIVAMPDGVEIPDVIGENYRRAREQFQELGLEVNIRRAADYGRMDDRYREYAVIGLEPEAGTRVPPGTEVRMTIND